MRAVADLEGTVGAKGGAAPVRRPRQNEAQARERILKTATAEFARHGFAGARVARIVKNAGSNPRMLYHYFGSKSALYVAVLENALGGLRTRELRLDVEHLDPLEGLLQLFDFMNSYFEQNRDLVTLLTAENLLKARYMRKSARIRDMSSPVLEMIAKFIKRGSRPAREEPRSAPALRADGGAEPVPPVQRPHAVDHLRDRPVGRSLEGGAKSRRAQDAGGVPQAGVASADAHPEVLNAVIPGRCLQHRTRNARSFSHRSLDSGFALMRAPE